MPLLRTVTAVLLFAFVAATAHATGYHLRGPGPKVGDTVRSETVTAMTDGTMNIDAGTFRLAGKTSVTVRNITETTVVEMDGESVTKVRVRIVADSQEQMVEMMGQRNNNTTNGPLHGKTLIGSFDEGKWTFVFENGRPDREQSLRLEEMAREYRFLDKSAVVYPDRAVKVGESWDVDAADLHSHFGGAERPTGKVTYTLDKVEEVDGEQLAHLTVAMDFSAKMTNTGEGTMTLRGNGPLVRSLKTYLDKSSTMTGTMEMHMAEDEVKMIMTGPMTVTATESRP